MDSTAFLAAVPGMLTIVGATLAAGLTYLFTKWKEREADWRRLKLDNYNEFVSALSGIVEGHATPEGHFRYVHAVNTLNLVASPPVVRAVYAYLNYNSSSKELKSQDQHDRHFTTLMKSIREDVHPTHQHRGEVQSFRLITVPADLRSSPQAPK